MQLSHVSAADAQAKTFELPAGVKYDAKTGEYTDNRSSFTANKLYGTTLSTIQENHQAFLKEQQKETVPLYKKPFVWIYNGLSNVFGMIKNAFSAIFSCFGSKEATAAENTEEKKGTTAAAKK